MGLERNIGKSEKTYIPRCPMLHMMSTTRPGLGEGRMIREKGSVFRSFSMDGLKNKGQMFHKSGE
jgi:hypothetical protein